MEARGLIRAGIAVAAALAVGAPAAAADETIYAGPPNQYFNPQVTIDQGEKLTFTNVDTVQHDVTAKAPGPDGKPLFASALTSTGGSEPVVGADAVPAGSYEFVCSIHPFMTGTLTVNGDAAAPPDDGSEPPPEETPPEDTTADGTPPALQLKVARVHRHRALVVALTSDEPATVGVTARAGRKRIAAGTFRLAAAGTRKVAVKLTKAGVRRFRHAHRVRVSVVARAADAAGNVTTAKAVRRVR